MAQTAHSREIEHIENRIALVNETDECLILITERTRDRHILIEVARARAYLGRLWTSLVAERRTIASSRKDE